MEDEIKVNWPQDAKPLTGQQIKPETPIMSADLDNQDDLAYVTFEQLSESVKEIIEITGQEIAPLVGGDTSGTALSVPAGPAGEVRTADVVSGKWYNFGSGPVQATADKRWRAYWDGTTWSLVDMGVIPQVEVVADLDSTDDNKALAASQGKVLNDKIPAVTDEFGDSSTEAASQKLVTEAKNSPPQAKEWVSVKYFAGNIVSKDGRIWVVKDNVPETLQTPAPNSTDWLELRENDYFPFKQGQAGVYLPMLHRAIKSLWIKTNPGDLENYLYGISVVRRTESRSQINFYRKNRADSTLLLLFEESTLNLKSGEEELGNDILRVIIDWDEIPIGTEILGLINQTEGNYEFSDDIYRSDNALNKVPLDGLNNLSSDISELDEELNPIRVVSKNELLSASLVLTPGFIHKNTGLRDVAAGFIATDYIPVTPGDVIVYTGRLYGNASICGYPSAAVAGFQTLVSGGSTALTADTQITFTVPDGIRYIRASFQDNTTNPNISWSKGINIPGTPVISSMLETTKKAELLFTNRVFRLSFTPEELLLGFIHKGTGDRQASAGWGVTDYIPVTPGDVIVYTGRLYGNASVCGYPGRDIAGFQLLVDTEAPSPTSDIQIEFTIPEGIRYIRASFHETSTDRYLQWSQGINAGISNLLPGSYVRVNDLNQLHIVADEIESENTSTRWLELKDNHAFPSTGVYIGRMGDKVVISANGVITEIN